jgi:hypothetical protein
MKNLTLLYMHSDVVIPALYKVWGKLSQARNDK